MRVVAITRDGVTVASEQVRPGVIRFDEPVTMQSGDYLEVTYSVTLDEG